MTTRVITGVDGLKAAVGEHLGYSEYFDVTQERVNQFAEATGDHQWIHVDVERAKSGPFGGPIAHGYLTLSLGPMLYPTVVRIEGFTMGVNYGANKVRFPSPVPVGSKIRLGPHAAHDLNTFTQHTDAIFWFRKIVAISPIFVFIPTSTNAPLKSATRNNVNCRRDLG